MNGLTAEEIMTIVSETIKKQLDLRVEKINTPPVNQNASNNTESYVAFASGVGRRRREELPESFVEYDVGPSDSASQLGGSELETVDYNAPNQLIMSTDRNNDVLSRVTRGETRVNINEPRLITVDNSDINVVLADGTVGDASLVEVDSDNEESTVLYQDDDLSNRLVPSELMDRIDATFGSDESEASFLYMNEVPAESTSDLTLAVHQKDKYSASNDIRASNSLNINDRIARVGYKASREAMAFKDDLRNSRNEASTLSRRVRTSIHRGLPVEATASYTREKKKKLAHLTAVAMPSVKSMVTKNKAKFTTTFNGKQKLIKKVTLRKKKKKQNIATVSEVTASRPEEPPADEVHQKQQRRARRKRRLVDEQAQYKVRMRREQASRTKKKRRSAPSISSELQGRLETVTAGERLVTKPEGVAAADIDDYFNDRDMHNSSYGASNVSSSDLYD